MNIYYNGELLNGNESKGVAIKKPEFPLKNKGRYLLAGLTLWAGLFTFYNLNKNKDISTFLSNVNSKVSQEQTIENKILKENLNVIETNKIKEIKSIEVNEKNYKGLDKLVQEQIFAYKSNPILLDAIKNSFSELSKYDDYINTAANLTGNSVSRLYALYSTESDGEIRAISDAGAAGPAQLMPGTAREMGLKVGKFIDERYSPKSLIKASEYLGKYVNSNETHAIFAAYNFGPGNVNKIIKKYGDDWEEFSKHLPKETYNYVIRLKAREKLVDQLNFRKKKLFSQEINETNIYTVKKGDNLFAIARKTNSQIKEIKRLNPTIRNYDFISPGMNLNIPKSL